MGAQQRRPCPGLGLLNSGMLLGAQGRPAQASTVPCLLASKLGWGGSAAHICCQAEAILLFNQPAGIGTISCPDISREEIVNACGIDDFHDGVNYTRTACVIAGGCLPVSSDSCAAPAGMLAAEPVCSDEGSCYKPYASWP